jgi:hypothetical protein
MISCSLGDRALLSRMADVRHKLRQYPECRRPISINLNIRRSEHCHNTAVILCERKRISTHRYLTSTYNPDQTIQLHERLCHVKPRCYRCTSIVGLVGY